MRERMDRLVITFPSTTAAMSMEEACHKAGIPGRLIPTPREFTAGCGLAWACELTERPRVTALLEEQRIPHGQIGVVAMF